MKYLPTLSGLGDDLKINTSALTSQCFKLTISTQMAKELRAVICVQKVNMSTEDNALMQNHF